MTPFSEDPVIGKLVVTTVELNHEQYRALVECFSVTPGLTRNLEPFDERSTFGLPVRPYKITALTPKIVRLLHRTLRLSGSFSVSISSYDYIPPAGTREELTENLKAFVRQSQLPSFLHIVRDQVREMDLDLEDPYKLAEMLFSEGLNESHLLELV